ncbi:MAG: phosphonate C-P lyase system protein PhnL [Pseudomonadota bacterium]
MMEKNFDTLSNQQIISVRNLSKTFLLHLMEGAVLPVVKNASLTVDAGECVVLGGPSGAGKSSILKMIYGNYRVDTGCILVRHSCDMLGDGVMDVATAAPRQILRLRESTIGYVSQFLRVIPRVSALDIVQAEVRDPAVFPEKRAKDLLTKLSIPERLWDLPPATFSGGEQQRINIARGLAAAHKVLLLDEPTASLDRHNREAVVELIKQKKSQGTAILAIFHDEDVRDELADRIVDVRDFAPETTAHHLANILE